METNETNVLNVHYISAKRTIQLQNQVLFVRSKKIRL